jgi:predicted ester cyclase
MSAKERRQAVLLQHTEVWGGGRLELIPFLYTEDYAGHFPGGYEVKGQKGIHDMVAGLRLAIPNWRQEVLDLQQRGLRVATRYRSWGTQTGPFLGVPGHGQLINILEASWFRMKGDRIAEQWAFPDSTLMNQQMTAKPA